MSTPISTAAVLGAGTMGHGIAHVAATSGMKVVLYDIEQSAAERGIASIQKNLEKGVAKAKITEEAKNEALENLTLTLERAHFDDAGVPQKTIAKAPLYVH